MMTHKETRATQKHPKIHFRKLFHNLSGFCRGDDILQCTPKKRRWLLVEKAQWVTWIAIFVIIVGGNVTIDTIVIINGNTRNRRVIGTCGHC